MIHLLKRDYEIGGGGRARGERDEPVVLRRLTSRIWRRSGILGATQEAAVVRRRLLAIEPDFTIERFIATTPLERESDREHYAQGLRLAGIPETLAPVGQPNQHLQDQEATP